MRKAYDTILCDYVSADAAARASSNPEPYRYECAFCWEEVRLCAAESKHMVAHFRHYSGNNDIECENYLGSPSDILDRARSQRKTRENVDFYFSSDTKLFYIGVKFNREEIEKYECENVRLNVRLSNSGDPFTSIPVDRRHFAPDYPREIIIEEFSHEYFISLSNETNNLKYSMFRRSAKAGTCPTVFKILANNEPDNYKAKAVRSNTIYTNTEYLFVFPNRPQSLNFCENTTVRQTLTFRTMQTDFTAFVVIFNQVTPQIKRLLQLWDFQIETNETLTLIWPPSKRIEDSFAINSNSAIVHSSFELLAHGNTNASSQQIVYLGDGLTRVHTPIRTKIYRRNAELILNTVESEKNEFQKINVSQIVSKSYRAKDENSFLFGRAGVIQLSKGTSLPLCISSLIRHYSYGYLDEIIVPDDPMKNFSGMSLIRDILKYYRRTEAFILDDFHSLTLSNDAHSYLKTCEKEGFINSAVKRFILEGRI